MHFKVIPCDFGPITKKENAENITLGDFKELRDQIGKYKDKSQHNFCYYFCSPIFDKLDKLMKKLDRSYKEETSIYNLFGDDRDKVKNIIEIIRNSANSYLEIETNGKGKSKILHRVSAKRVEGVKKLKKICEDIKSKGDNDSAADDIKEKENQEKEKIENATTKLKGLIGDCQDVRKGTLLDKKVFEGLQSSITGVMTICTIKRSVFYRAISCIDK